MRDTTITKDEFEVCVEYLGHEYVANVELVHYYCPPIPNAMWSDWDAQGLDEFVISVVDILDETGNTPSVSTQHDLYHKFERAAIDDYNYRRRECGQW